MTAAYLPYVFTILLVLLSLSGSTVNSFNVLRQVRCSETCEKSYQAASANCGCNLRLCDAPSGSKKKNGVICTASAAGDALVPDCTIESRTGRNGVKFTCKCKTKYVKKVSYFPRAKGSDKVAGTVRNCFKTCIVTNQFGSACGAGTLTKAIMIARAKECCEGCNGRFMKNKICRKMMAWA